MIDRRAFLTTAGVLPIAAGLGWPAFAAASTAMTSDGFKITTFSDGHLALPLSMIAPSADPAAGKAILSAAGHTGDSYKSPLNVTLIEKGDEKILVDVGSGPNFMTTAGKLTASLEGAGVDPAAVTKVIYTHAHPDHVWGTINEFDELSFPNATYFISEDEWNFWMAADVLKKLPQERATFAVGAQRNLKAAKERITTIKTGSEVVAGIHVIATPGHTPGHISVEIGAGKDAIVVVGDALTHPIVSFQHPDWKSASDQQPDRAIATRRKLLDKLAADGNRIIGYHLPVPGAGRVERKGSGYVFAPLA